MEPNKPKQHKTFIWIVVAAAAVVAVGSIYSSQIDFSSKIIKGFEQATDNFLVQTLHSDSFTPPPLRGVFGVSQSPLTDEGVLTWTNKYREDAGAKNLVINDTLSEMAQQKLRDMFGKQYFEHVSPTGVGPGDLAKQAGYDYIVIGENLALGNFDGDKALLDAWMASPGHRANILNVRYREIGISVGQGSFEGKKTWIAVQEFGLPIDACPQPSVIDKTTIDRDKKNIDTMEASLNVQKALIDKATLKYDANYSAEVAKYNTLVQQFNASVISLKTKISNYNKQVSVFNTCAEVSSTTPEEI